MTRNEANKYNILIIADNSELSSMYSNILSNTEGKPYIVEWLNNEHDAFLKIIESNPELVICSYQSSSISAQRLIKSLNNFPHRQRPGVLVIGPKIDEKGIRQLIFMGALDYLAEPVAPSRLRIKVNNAISVVLFRKDHGEEEIIQIKDLAEYVSKSDEHIDLPELKKKLEELKRIEWNIQPEDVIKRSNDNWLFIAKGPTPEYGSWKKTEIANKWEWQWSDEIFEAYSREELPSFFFEGVEPKWTKGKWENGRWVMCGKNPSLSYKNSGEVKKDVINFSEGKPNIMLHDVFVPSTLMESLAETFKLEGESKVEEVLSSCHYAQSEIDKLMPQIKRLSVSISEPSSNENKSGTSFSYELEQLGKTVKLSNNNVFEKKKEDKKTTEVSKILENTVEKVCEEQEEQESGIWSKLNGRNQTKPSDRLNIFSLAIDEAKRKISNIHLTVIDILDDHIDIVLTSESIDPNRFQLSFDYFVNQIFKEVKQVVSSELTSERYNTLYFPYFGSDNRLCGLAMFRKNLPKVNFTMNEKIICSALANSIKTAFV